MNFADKAENVNVQNHFFDAQRQILQKKDQMEQDFWQALMQTLNDAASLEMKNNTVQGQEELALLNKEIYEKNLALQTLTDHAERHNYQQLYALSQRLSVVSNMPPLDFEDLPASPSSITRAFTQATNRLNIESDAQLILYTLYDKYVLYKLTDIYDALNSALVEAGILPLLKYKLKKAADTLGKAPAQKPPTQTPDQQSNNAVGPSSTESVGLADETMGRICDLLANSRRARRTVGAAPSQRHSTASNAEVARAFSDVEIAPTTALPRELIYAQDRDVVQINKEFLTQVRNLLVQQRQSVKSAIGIERLSNIQEDVIDVVGMLFENMLDDQTVPGMVKALLGHLHTPYIKFALNNPEFLSEQSHPARTFFSLAVDGSSVWVDELDLNVGIYPDLKNIVNTIVRDGKPDQQSFQSFHQSLSARIKALEEKSKATENRSTEAEKGRAKLEYTKDLAQNTTDDIFGGQEITLECKRFVDGVWIDYLILVLLRDRGNAAWKKAESLGKQILLLDQQAVNGTVSPEDIQTLSTRVMEEIGALLPHKSSMIDKFLDSLQRHGAATMAMQVQNNTRPEEVIDSSLEDICEKLRGLPANVWFEFTPVGAKKYKAKLSWYNSHSDNFLFVASNGQKVALKEIARLAKDVSDGTTRILPHHDRSFFDRALASIKNALENTVAPQSKKQQAG